MMQWKQKYAIFILAMSSAFLAIDLSDPPFSDNSGQLNLEDFIGSYVLGKVESGARSILVVQEDWTFIWDYGFGRFNGTMMWDGTKIVLETDAEEAITENLVPIKWGARRYLIPVQIKSLFSDEIQSYNEQISKFCERISLGVEPREYQFGVDYLLHGDWEKSVSGAPLTSWGTEVCS
jgi:hypothetical protein